MKFMLHEKPINLHQYRIIILLICCALNLFLNYKNDSIRIQILSEENASPHKLNSRFDYLLFSSSDIVCSSSKVERPTLPDSLLSLKRHFMIHYTTSGDDAVSPADSNENSIPDRIEKIVDAFEQSYKVEIEQLNYQLPPSFEGGTKPYDIYVLDLNSNYAITVTEGVDSTAWEQKNVSSYILFDNDFVGAGFIFQGDNAIKTIAAHEFFHAIQLGYVFRKTDSFFFELTAVWMEDQVFDEIDNYLYYLDYFFSAPDVPLIAVSFTIPGIFKHIYGSSVFAFYIAENFGQNAIRHIWEQMSDQSAMEAVNNVFKRNGSSFEWEFVKFAMWNFFTGSRSRSDFSYRDSHSYPEICVEKDTIIHYYHQHDGQGYFLTTSYHIFHPVEAGNYKALLYSDNKDHWRMGVIIYDKNSIRTDFINPDKTIQLENILKGQTIVLIPCNVDRFTNPSYVYLKHKPEKYTFILQRETTILPTHVKPFQIQHIYPNPFSRSVIFTIKKIRETSLNIQIFNVQGQEVDRMVIHQLPLELNQIIWQAFNRNQNLPSGVYLCRFSAGKFSEIKKILLYR